MHGKFVSGVKCIDDVNQRLPSIILITLRKTLVKTKYICHVKTSSTFLRENYFYLRLNDGYKSKFE